MVDITQFDGSCSKSELEDGPTICDDSSRSSMSYKNRFEQEFRKFFCSSCLTRLWQVYLPSNSWIFKCEFQGWHKFSLTFSMKQKPRCSIFLSQTITK
ncbi:hypothetical protein AVEN_237861-1 [Araneus ventricosus]|uniref:Uncharacterized protein n=1 Tax=Araneus ventricosus TaxID=182803 RepID=A0A4Y2L748_ARAVE|nr:hypothetical protein AVEN_237861-1 [Araneus ventricosus]